MNYETIEKSKLFSIEKRSRTLKNLLDTLNLTWYSYEGFPVSSEMSRKVQKILSKWNTELLKIQDSELDHVELAITKKGGNYLVWIQRTTNNSMSTTRSVSFRGSEVMDILNVFSVVGTFNDFGEWIWV